MQWLDIKKYKVKGPIVKQPCESYDKVLMQLFM